MVTMVLQYYNVARVVLYNGYHGYRVTVELLQNEIKY